MNDARQQAAIYCRISLASMGDMTKVDEQERLCREACRVRGWEVGEVYVDNSRSAWRRDRKRPAWDAMLAAIGAGKFGAIVSYWGDRIVRQPRDLEDLLDLREVRKISLASVMGQYDFDNKDHRMMMRWEVARACNESDTISDRMKAGIERRRRAGVVNSGGRGGRTFGFAADGITWIPGEIEAVQEVNRRVLAGDGVRTIATALVGRGVTTTAGNPIDQNAVKRIITSPRYAGLMPDGKEKGAWEAPLSREDWEAARAVAAARSGLTPAGHNARRYLLSGIARCGECESGLQPQSAFKVKRRGRTVMTAPAYVCVKPGCRKIHRSLALLDAYVSRRVVNKLANPLNPAGRLMAGSGLAAEYQALAGQRAEAEAAIADHRRAGLPALLARLDSIDERLAELRELAGGDARTRILKAHAGITAEEFAALPLATRRALVTACYRVTVLPASKRGPGFRTEDVQLSPR